MKKDTTPRQGRFVDGRVVVNVQADCVEVFMIDEAVRKMQMTRDAARQLLQDWEPDLKNRGHFLRVANGCVFRSYDVKSIVRCLRKVFKGEPK